jgi:hypothetical protein
MEYPTKPFGKMVDRCYVKAFGWGGLGVEPTSLPLLACSYNNVYVWWLTTAKFGVHHLDLSRLVRTEVGHHIWQDLRQIGGQTLFKF